MVSIAIAMAIASDFAQASTCRAFVEASVSTQGRTVHHDRYLSGLAMIRDSAEHLEKPRADEAASTCHNCHFETGRLIVGRLAADRGVVHALVTLQAASA